MAVVVDYSYNHPSIDKLHTLGAIGVMRYVSPQSAKNLSGAEYRQLKAAGFAVGLVWEGSASGALRGYSGGVSDGREANRQADLLGYPLTAAIYFAVDFDDNDSQLATIRDYFRGVNDGSVRKFGVYGSYSVMQAVTADFYWQTSAWSGGSKSPKRNLYQHVYLNDVDLNDVVTANWGQDKLAAPAFPAFPLPAGQYFGRGGETSGHNLNLWQAQMAKRGWNVSVDGGFSNVDRDIVLAFQAEKGLTVDGLIGVLTWNAAWTAPIT